MGKSIHFLIASSNWRKLTKKLEKKPKKKKYVDELKNFCHSDDSGVERYPIHDACRNGITKQALKAILAVYPEAAKQLDDEGSTPLHYVLHYDERCKIDVLEVLLDAYPKAVGIQDNFGCTPMFHAVEHKIGVKMEKLVLLLRSHEAVEALTVVCQPSEGNDRRGRKDCLMMNQNSERFKSIRNEAVHNPRGSVVEPYKTAPLHKIWNIALNTHSSERFYKPAKMGRREIKKVGKRLEKAQVMLEAVYLKQSINMPKYQSKVEITKLKSFPEQHSTIAMKPYNSLDNVGIRKHVQFASEENLLISSSVRDFGKIPKSPYKRRNWSRFRRGSKKQKKSSESSDIGVENEVSQESRRKLRKIGKRDSYSNPNPNPEFGANKFRILHAVLTYHSYLPDAAYEYAMVHYPDQVNEKEEKTGNFPLHIACAMSKGRDFDRPSILTELLRKNGNATKKINRQGQLPLHVALSNEDQWEFESINELLNANAWACEEVDTVNKLFPFQLAAVGKKNSADMSRASKCDQLSAIYTLLKEAPLKLAELPDSKF